MKILNLLNPLWVLAAAGLGFAAWVVYDATQPLPPKPADANPDDPYSNEVTVNNVSDFKRLGSIQPGMPQAEVQRVLKMVESTPGEMGPADLKAGYPTYQMNYRTVLTRQLPNWKQAGGPFVPGPHVITFVFDARHPGHPLINVIATPDPELPSGRKVQGAIISATAVQ